MRDYTLIGAMKGRGWTTRDLARIASVSGARIAAIVAGGERTPSEDYAIRSAFKMAREPSSPRLIGDPGSFMRAVCIATEAHAGQRDKAGAPYIAHVRRVATAAKRGDAAIVGMLHDVVEDSDWTLENLVAEGFSERVVDAVAAVTRRESEEYSDSVRRAGANPLGRIVKRADLTDNSKVDRLEGEPTDRDVARTEKYRQALALLDEIEGRRQL